MTKLKLTKNIIHWLLLVVIIVYLISGFGITEFRVVEALTSGLLTKKLSFKIHDYVLAPLLILLSLHMFMSLFSRLLWKVSGKSIVAR